jgi:hypothetical protein
MRAGDHPKFLRAENAGEAHEVLHRVFVGAAGVPVADVGEPFDLGRHVGEFLEFDGGEQPVRGLDFGRQLVGRVGVVHAVPLPMVLILIKSVGLNGFAVGRSSPHVRLS